jgi:acetylornithine deacetylase
VPGAAGEGEAARHVAGWLGRRGFEVRLQETGEEGRPNVIGRRPGTGGGRSLMLNGHLDTVGVAGMDDPHGARTDRGRLYGRGAIDMKGGLAALLHAAARADGVSGDLIVTAVVDEEYGSIGTEAALRQVGADGAIVAEPTGLDVTIAHKGFVWLEVSVDGVAAHGSRPDLGVDAIAKMGAVLVAVGELGEELAAGSGHPLLGPGSVHASLIEGGQELSSYPDRCLLQLERRTVPGEDAATALAELQRIIDRLAEDDASFQASVRATFERKPLTADAGAALVVALRRAVRQVTGEEPAVVGHSGWMDAALIAEAGIPTVVFGPTGAGLHAAVEWVDLESVQRCSDAVLATIRDFCA